jgi:hypothetical protein
MQCLDARRSRYRGLRRVGNLSPDSFRARHMAMMTWANFRRRASSQAATELASITDATGRERDYVSENRRFDQHSLACHDARLPAHRASSQSRTPKMMCTTRCTSLNRFASSSYVTSTYLWSVPRLRCPAWSFSLDGENGQHAPPHALRVASRRPVTGVNQS